MRVTPARARSRGFSTMDVLIGGALSLIAISTAQSAFVTQTRALETQSAYSQSQNTTRTVLDLITRELRMAAYDPSGLAIPLTTGSCPAVKLGIMEATGTRLKFRQDLNGDGDVSDSGETVTYDLSEGNIRRQDGAATPVVLVNDVPQNGLAFRYFDTAHAELGSGTLTQNQRNCVAKVMITVRATTTAAHAEAGHAAVHTSIAESEVAIRNLSLINF